MKLSALRTTETVRTSPLPNTTYAEDKNVLDERNGWDLEYKPEFAAVFCAHPQQGDMIVPLANIRHMYPKPQGVKDAASKR